MSRRTPHDRLFTFQPPYRGLIPTLRASVLEPTAGRAGTVLVWGVSPSVSEEVLQDVRQRPGGVSLVCILPPAETMGERDAFYRMIERCLPAVVLPFHSEPSPYDLQTLLRRGPHNLPGDVMDYLVWRGVTIDMETRRLLRRTLELSADLTSVEGLARGIYLSRRALGRRFQEAGIPVPSHWLHFGRVLRAAIRIQADNTPLNQVAYDLGYSDGFALSNQMHRLTGLRPSEVRERLGWMWFAEQWLRTEASAGGFSRGLTQVIAMGGHRSVPRPSGTARTRRIAGAIPRHEAQPGGNPDEGEI